MRARGSARPPATAPAAVLAVWIVTCLLWSSVWLFIKLGLHDLPPLSFAGIRLAIAIAILLPVLVARRVPLPRSGEELRMVALTGFLLLGVNYGLVFWGARLVPSGLTAVLQAATPVFGVALAAAFFRERASLTTLAGLAAGIAGVAVVFSDQLRVSGLPALLGCAAILGGAACVAASYLLVKSRGGHMHPLALTAGQMICGAVPLLLAGAVLEGNPLSFRWSRGAVVAVLYLALVGSVAAFGLNYWLLRRLEATKVMFMSVVEPPVAVLLGAVVLAESLTERALWGSALVLVSAGTVLMSGASAKDAGTPAAEGGGTAAVDGEDRGVRG